MKSRKTKLINKAIDSALKDFDRCFDDTVVDTYTFDKVIQADEVKNTIYYYLNDSDESRVNRLTTCKEAISTYVVHEVNELYKHKHRTLFNEEVYHDYIDQLFERISINSTSIQ